MRIDVLTIFPRMFRVVLGESILGRAQAQGLVTVRMHDLRRYTHDRRRTVDDRPYGGGPGMVMKPEPIVEALEALQRAGARRLPPGTSPRTLLLSPRGEPLTSGCAKRLAGEAWLILVCGRYEGVDERVRAFVDGELSIGDYVLTGGELPAMVAIDAVARYVPGVIGHAQATAEESFADGLLEYPQYTRPPVFRDLAVPAILRTGDHAQVARWRRAQATAVTRAHRPDLLTARTGSRRGRREQQRGS
jgi:tRNA (guanine37-N1)-methyltransferase